MSFGSKQSSPVNVPPFGMGKSGGGRRGGLNPPTKHRVTFISVRSFARLTAAPALRGVCPGGFPAARCRYLSAPPDDTALLPPSPPPTSAPPPTPHPPRAPTRLSPHLKAERNEAPADLMRGGEGGGEPAAPRSVPQRLQRGSLLRQGLCSICPHPRGTAHSRH